jgi:predicted TIM-barrel fold metal-dependent hydrolase
MKIVDSHTHTLARLHGAREFCKEEGIGCAEEDLLRQMAEAGVERLISITDDLDQPTPIGLDDIRKQRGRLDFIAPVLGVNPHKTTAAGLDRLAAALKKGEARGVKIWAGYYHVRPDARLYDRVYKLAGRHEVPVMVHTGDTFWKGRARRDPRGRRLPPRERWAIADMAHPYVMDEVASRFPETDFLLAHVGNPWVNYAALVAYRNENVFLDLSAFVIGGSVRSNPSGRDAAEAIGWAMRFVGDDSKFLYGSDWPLVQMKDYLEFVRAAVPADAHNAVFRENAVRLFRL